MRQTFNLFLSLFISCFILLLGNGLINVLLTVRMDLDGFNTDVIGLVLSLYYVGMLLGALYSKTLIARAGHIRMFAGCVAVAAVSILICSLFSDGVLWGAMRLLIGFCNACAFTAMESWLSDGSSKDNRGKVLAVYNAVVLAGLFGGQFLMNVASPGEATLFVVAGILLCASIVPMVLSNNSGPLIENVESMSLLKLYRISPLGVVSCVASGLIYSALFNLLPVFAGDHGIVDLQLSLYVGAAILGAFLLQFPVGYLSDSYDRRTVLLVLLAISATMNVVVVALASAQAFSVLFVATAISAGIVACTYPLSIAEVFDRLRQNEMVAAMSSMILAFSVGGVLGPYSASIVMEYFGSDALFYYLAIVQLQLAVFVLYRMGARHALPINQQEQFVMQAAAVTASVELDPRSEFVEQTQRLTTEAETAVSIAEFDPAAAVKMARAVALYDPALGVGVAAAVATVDGIDVLRLYEVMKEVLPGKISEITQAIITTRPELGYQLVSKMAEWYPEQVVDVAAEIGQAIPELRVAMARAAIAAAPESATQVAEYYASVLAEEHDAVRPADRGEDSSEESVIDIATQLWRGSADQALDVAVAMADAMPNASVPLAQQYIASGAGNIVDDMSESEMAERLDNDVQVATDTASVVSVDRDEEPQAAGQSLAEEAPADYLNTVELVSRLAEAAPEQALDMAVAVVEALPDSAAGVAAEMASTISDRPDQDVTAGDEESAFDEAMEIVHRLTEASPDKAMDVAVAVVEAVPNSAAEVATQYAGTIASSEEQGPTEVNEEPGFDEAVELVHRLTEASPDMAMDVAVAVVEELPDSAAEVAAEYAGTMAGSEEHDTIEVDEELDFDEAVELVRRLTQASPDMAMDVAVAVVEELPDSAAEVAAQYANTMADNEQPAATAHSEEPTFDEAVELVQRLTEASPEMAMDVAVAVVEGLPDSAGEVAAEYAGTMAEGESTVESDNDDAVEFVQRLTEASPDMAMDVAVAVVEAVPDSAVDVATLYAGTVAEGDSSARSDNEEAVELLQRLSEAAPDSVMDMAVAVVEVIPAAASELVDAISEGAASVEGEWMNIMDDKPDS